MMLRVTDNGNANAQPRRNVALWDCLRCVVCALGVHVGMNFREKFPDIETAEKYNVIHRAHRGDELRASCFGQNWAARALENPSAVIGIERDDKHVAFAARAFEITHMADVQHVKNAVRQDNALSQAAVFCEPVEQDFPRDDFFCCPAHGSRTRHLAAHGIEQFSAAHAGGAALHHDEAAGNAGDVRSFGETRSGRER